MNKQFDSAAPTGWLIVDYCGKPQVDQFYITDKGFVQQCTVKNEAIDRMIVEKV